MNFCFNNHYNKYLILLFFILIACQLQEPTKNHGILFLENRSEKLAINKSNRNDVLKIIGQPHSRSVNNENIWIYIERTITKGKYHKLGRHELKSNNTLVLTFDKYGVLKNKELYDINDIQKVKFSKKNTENKLSNKSFVESLLGSVRQKMYGNRNRKK